MEISYFVFAVSLSYHRVSPDDSGWPEAPSFNGVGFAFLARDLTTSEKESKFLINFQEYWLLSSSSSRLPEKGQESS